MNSCLSKAGDRSLPWTERVAAVIDSPGVKFLSGNVLGASVFGLLVPTLFDSSLCDMGNFQMGSPASIVFLVMIPTSLLFFSGSAGVNYAKERLEQACRK